MSFEDVVDEHIAARIVYWMGGPYFAPNLRMVSRRCARMIRAPPKISDTQEIIEMALKIGDSATCLRALARKHDYRSIVMSCAAKSAATYDRRDILVFIFEKTKGNAIVYESDAIHHAALAGNLGLCEFIRDCIICNDEWKRDTAIHAFPFFRMMVGAARANRVDLFKLGLKWIEEFAHSFPDLDEPMHQAAESGSIDICKLAHELAIEHGQPIYVERVLQHAAFGGSIEGCKLAREWGARQYDVMLHDAAGSGSIEMCKFARGWLDATGPYSPKVFLNMMMNAARYSKMETLHLAYEWFVEKSKREPNLEEIYYNVITGSAKSISIESCEFLYGIMQRSAGLNFAAAMPEREALNPSTEMKALMVDIIDYVMKYAVMRGDIEMCEMLHSWGAVHYESYLEFAVCYDIYEPISPTARKRTAEVRELVKKWMAERDATAR